MSKRYQPSPFDRIAEKSSGMLDSAQEAVDSAVSTARSEAASASSPRQERRQRRREEREYRREARNDPSHGRVVDQNGNPYELTDLRARQNHLEAQMRGVRRRDGTGIADILQSGAESLGLGDLASRAIAAPARGVSAIRSAEVSPSDTMRSLRDESAELSRLTRRVRHQQGVSFGDIVQRAAPSYGMGAMGDLVAAGGRLRNHIETSTPADAFHNIRERFLSKSSAPTSEPKMSSVFDRIATKTSGENPFAKKDDDEKSEKKDKGEKSEKKDKKKGGKKKGGVPWFARFKKKDDEDSEEKSKSKDKGDEDDEGSDKESMDNGLAFGAGAGAGALAAPSLEDALRRILTPELSAQAQERLQSMGRSASMNGAAAGGAAARGGELAAAAANRAGSAVGGGIDAAGGLLQRLQAGRGAGAGAARLGQRAGLGAILGLGSLAAFGDG